MSLSTHRPSTGEPESVQFLSRWFTGVRRDGFLSSLGPHSWHTLSALLSFGRKDGQRSFTLDQLAAVLGCSRQQASEQLSRLAEVTWHGQALVSIDTLPDGTVCGARLAPVERFEAIDTLDAPDDARSGSEESASRSLTGRLAEVGLNPAQIRSLRTRYPSAAISQQLEWLPSRNARNPAALLIRAIEQDWEQPKGDE